MEHNMFNKDNKKLLRETLSDIVKIRDKIYTKIERSDEALTEVNFELVGVYNKLTDISLGISVVLNPHSKSMREQFLKPNKLCLRYNPKGGV
jgi:hypothetical protein